MENKPSKNILFIFGAFFQFLAPKLWIFHGFSKFRVFRVLVFKSRVFRVLCILGFSGSGSKKVGVFGSGIGPG